ncbi:hypothetical protein BH11PLA1_BH11PLA1_02430 [soil metagenome]
MFIAQAHSFTQQARLAVTLAWIAGYTNVVSILVVGTVTSHASGTASYLGEKVASGAWSEAGFLLFLLCAFMLGAGLSGFASELARRRGWESIYVLPMALEAALLAGFALLIALTDSGSSGAGAAGGEGITGTAKLGAVALAALAMGLQNATITRFSSGAIRTTHVTGVLTDLGSDLVQGVWWTFDRRKAIRTGALAPLLAGARTHPTVLRVALLASIIVSFALGAGMGTLAFAQLPRVAMFAPVLLLVWIIYQDIRAPIAEIEPSDLIATQGLTLPSELSVFSLRHDPRYPAAVHRVGDLLTWADGLPPALRAAVLDFSAVRKLDPQTIGELGALAERFAATGRALVIAGMERADIERLGGSAADLGARADLCPDAELAIALGINRVLEQRARGERRD